jgi:D-xylose transport system substrate-binding protein
MMQKKLGKAAAAVVTLGVLTAGVAGCGTSGQTGNAAGNQGNGVKIGLSFGDLKLERWHHDEDYFVNYVKAHSNNQVLVQDANGSSSTQVSQCENLISQGVKVLVIVPQDGSTLAQVVNDAQKDGVKVIAYDRLILNSKPDLYVSFDNIKVGELQAQYLVQKAPKGKYVLIEGSPTDNNAYMFYQGQMNVLQPLINKGDIQIVYKQFTPDWSTENALNEMQDALTKTHNQIDAVLAANDSTALGVVQALKQQQLAGKIPVTGQDADLANCQLIVQGLQTMTVYKPIKQEAETAAQAALDFAEGKTPQTNGTVNNKTADIPAILLQPVAVTKDNMKDTVIKDGFHTEAQVYGGSQ